MTVCVSGCLRGFSLSPPRPPSVAGSLTVRGHWMSVSLVFLLRPRPRLHRALSCQEAPRITVRSVLSPDPSLQEGSPCGCTMRCWSHYNPCDLKNPSLFFASDSETPHKQHFIFFFSIRCKRTVFTLLCASGSPGYFVTTPPLFTGATSSAHVCVISSHTSSAAGPHLWKPERNEKIKRWHQVACEPQRADELSLIIISCYYYIISGRSVRKC